MSTNSSKKYGGVLVISKYPWFDPDYQFYPRGSLSIWLNFCKALGVVHKLRYAIEVGGWSAKYNYCNIYKVDM